MDLADFHSIERSLKTVKEHCNGLEVIINNAAMRFPDEQELFGAVRADEFMHSMNVNAVGPFMLVQIYIDIIKAGNDPRIINVTTGPLILVEHNLPYNYCISKAALNMITRYFAVNLSEFGIISIGMYPGWVQTEMGYSGGGNPPLTVEQSAEGIVNVISNLTMKDNENFIAWNGQTLSALVWQLKNNQCRKKRLTNIKKTKNIGDTNDSTRSKSHTQRRRMEWKYPCRQAHGQRRRTRN